MEHPVNEDFMNSLDRVNETAEKQPGFVWRFIGDENNAIDVRAFDDPDIVINMSVWTDLRSLVNFVYRNDEHRRIMRRRKEWFEKIDFYMALWWVEKGRRPTVEEGKIRLELLKQNGPSYSSFTFRHPFAAPGGERINPFRDECA